MALSSSRGRRHIHRKLDDDYEVSVTVLGEGVTGEVFKAQRKSSTLTDASRSTHAVKTLQIIGAEVTKLERMRREVDVLMCVDHPHIARIDDVYETGDATHIVMECCEGGDVCDRYNEFGKFSEGVAADTIRQMLLAIQYLHNQGIVHRDVKMEHFMYTSKNSSVLKMIDFGLCQHWQAQMPNMTDVVGTFGWVAPEVLEKSYTNKCDLWSLGCIAFNLLLGFRPFHDEVSKDNFLAIRKGAYREKDGMWSSISEEARDFILKLLEVDPDKRLTAQEALQHAWMARWQVEQTLRPSRSIIAPLRHFSQNTDLIKFCLRTCARTDPRGQEKDLIDTFVAMDREKKGTLTLDDVLTYTTASEKDGNDLDVSSCFNALRVDPRGEIHFSEFVAAMLSPELSVGDPTYKDALLRYCGALVDEALPLPMGSSTVSTSTSLINSTPRISKTSAPLSIATSSSRYTQDWRSRMKVLTCWSHKSRRVPVGSI